MVMPYHLHMPSYFLETFTEYPSNTYNESSSLFYQKQNESLYISFQELNMTFHSHFHLFCCGREKDRFTGLQFQ